jgi:hypothetical protein
MAKRMRMMIKEARSINEKDPRKTGEGRKRNIRR